MCYQAVLLHSYEMAFITHGSTELHFFMSHGANLREYKDGDLGRQSSILLFTCSIFTLSSKEKNDERPL